MSAFYTEPNVFQRVALVLQHNDWGFLTYPYNFDNWKYVGLGSFFGGSLISAFALGRMLGNASDLSPLESFAGPTILSLAIGATCFGFTVRPRATFVIIAIQTCWEIGRNSSTK